MCLCLMCWLGQRLIPFNVDIQHSTIPKLELNDDKFLVEMLQKLCAVHYLELYWYSRLPKLLSVISCVLMCLKMCKMKGEVDLQSSKVLRTDRKPSKVRPISNMSWNCVALILYWHMYYWLYFAYVLLNLSFTDVLDCWMHYLCIYHLCVSWWRECKRIKSLV